MREALRELSGNIDSDTMRRLNYELDGKHRPAREIARNFPGLRSAGSINRDRCRGLLPEIRILFCLLQQLIEFPVQHLPLVLLGRERLLKGLLALPASPLCFCTAAAKSSIVGGFTGSSCEITARSSASTFSFDWQHGQDTSNSSRGMSYYVARGPLQTP